MFIPFAIVTVGLVYNAVMTANDRDGAGLLERAVLVLAFGLLCWRMMFLRTELARTRGDRAAAKRRYKALSDEVTALHTLVMTLRRELDGVQAAQKRADRARATQLMEFALAATDGAETPYSVPPQARPRLTVVEGEDQDWQDGSSI